MIAGGIDLSVGSTVALVTVCMAVLGKKVDPSLPESLRAWKLALPIALILGVGLGGLCGAINGALIAGLRVVPFIITLGSYQVYRGLATWLSSSTTVYVPGEAKPWWFGRILATEPEPDGSWWPRGLGPPGLSILLALTLRYSLLGRYAYAVGSERGDRPALRDQRALDQDRGVYPGRPGDRPQAVLNSSTSTPSATDPPPAGLELRSCAARDQ
jgi:ribose/xylose/arabinose/galactoside ABC-type transport system permease subunit